MFTKDGMRICKAKSKLKSMLQIEVSQRNAGDANVTIIDGSALLWTIHWPADGSAADIGVNVKTWITKYLTNSNVYSHQTPVRGIFKRIYKRDVIHQATCFISACYAIKNTTDMSNTWLFVRGGGSLLLTKLVCSPTKKEAFIENVKKAHFQGMMWRDANGDLRTLNPENIGWKKDKKTSLSPTLLPDNSNLSQTTFWKDKMWLQKWTPCNSRRCGCKDKCLPCTIFV